MTKKKNKTTTVFQQQALCVSWHYLFQPCHRLNMCVHFFFYFGFILFWTYKRNVLVVVSFFFWFFFFFVEQIFSSFVAFSDLLAIYKHTNWQYIANTNSSKKSKWKRRHEKEATSPKNTYIHTYIGTFILFYLIYLFIFQT